MNEAAAVHGYKSSIKSTGSDRGIEYQVFARITRELAIKDTGQPDYIPNRSKALYENLRLWTTLAMDVANDNNALPNELRSKLFYLAEFTRNHTAKIYAGKAAADILVEINTIVMRGLRGGAKNAE